MKTIAWFAGVFWCAVGVSAHGLACWMVTWPGTWYFSMLWPLVTFDAYAGKMALNCAREAGLEADDDPNA